MANNTETELQRDILLRLNCYGGNLVRAYRLNNGGIYDARSGTYRKPGAFHPAGLADIMVLAPDKVLFLEVKIDNGKQSADQVEFQTICEARNIPYAVVRSPKDACDVLRKYKIIGEVKK